MEKNISAYLLPIYDTDEEKKETRRHSWNTEHIGPEQLKKSTPVKLTQIAAEREYATLHSFRYQAEIGRSVYVQVKKGLTAFGGYILRDSADAVAVVPAYPRSSRSSTPARCCR